MDSLRGFVFQYAPGQTAVTKMKKKKGGKRTAVRRKRKKKLLTRNNPRPKILGFGVGNGGGQGEVRGNGGGAERDLVCIQIFSGNRLTKERARLGETEDGRTWIVRAKESCGKEGRRGGGGRG